MEWFVGYRLDNMFRFRPQLQTRCSPPASYSLQRSPMQAVDFWSRCERRVALCSRRRMDRLPFHGVGKVVLVC